MEIIICNYIKEKEYKIMRLYPTKVYKNSNLLKDRNFRYPY